MTKWVKTGSDPEELGRWLLVALKEQATGDIEEEIPVDYAAFMARLSWLNSCLSAGTLLPGQLLKDEAQGLMLMDQGARELGEKLQRCRHCGHYQEATLTCRHCGKSMSSTEHRAPSTGR